MVRAIPDRDREQYCDVGSSLLIKTSCLLVVVACNFPLTSSIAIRKPIPARDQRGRWGCQSARHSVLQPNQPDPPQSERRIPTTHEDQNRRGNECKRTHHVEMRNVLYTANACGSVRPHCKRNCISSRWTTPRAKSLQRNTVSSPESMRLARLTAPASACRIRLRCRAAPRVSTVSRIMSIATVSTVSRVISAARRASAIIIACISGQCWASTHQHSNPKPLHLMSSAPVVDCYAPHASLVPIVARTISDRYSEHLQIESLRAFAEPPESQRSHQSMGIP